jgi:hypothetical protein
MLRGGTVGNMYDSETDTMYCITESAVMLVVVAELCALDVDLE